MSHRLHIHLLKLQRRRRWVAAVQGGLWGGLWGGWVSAALGLAVGPSALWMWPTLAAAGYVRGYFQPVSLRQVAHQADQKLQLQERLLTCLGHLQEGRPPTAVSQLLLEETTERLEQLPLAGVYPNLWRRLALRWLVPALCWLALPLLWPNLPQPTEEPVHRQLRLSQQRLQKALAKLAQTRPELAQTLQRLPQQVPSQAARQLQQHLQKLHSQMAEQRAELDRLGANGASAPAKAAQLARELRQSQQLSQALQQELRQLPNCLAPKSGQQMAQSGGPVQPGQGQRGNGRSDFGKGSTNQAQKGGEASQKGQNRQGQAQSHKRGQFEALYQAQRQHLGAQDEQVQLRGSRGRLLRSQQNQLGQGGPAQPLDRAQENFLMAKAQAEQAVAEEAIPAAHRDAVRRYFEAADPR